MTTSQVSDLELSLFVGDAAGRVKDFADSDRKWALNVGIPFHTPEVCCSSFQLVRDLSDERNIF
jgi:hypothetical protein